MNKLKLLLILISFYAVLILSCNRNNFFKGKNIDSSCKELFQDLIKHTIRVDSNYIDFVWLDNTKTKKEAYIEFSERMIKGTSKKNRECLSHFSKEDIIRQFGHPNSIRSKGRDNDWYYVYKFGAECPYTKRGPIHTYDECNFFNFKFDEFGQLIYVYVDLNAMQWE